VSGIESHTPAQDEKEAPGKIRTRRSLFVRSGRVRFGRDTLASGRKEQRARPCGFATLQCPDAWRGRQCRRRSRADRPPISGCLSQPSWSNTRAAGGAQSRDRLVVGGIWVALTIRPAARCPAARGERGNRSWSVIRGRDRVSREVTPSRPTLPRAHPSPTVDVAGEQRAAVGVLDPEPSKALLANLQQEHDALRSGSAAGRC
jgi:hypothetical protein